MSKREIAIISIIAIVERGIFKKRSIEKRNKELITKSGNFTGSNREKYFFLNAESGKNTMILLMPKIINNDILITIYYIHHDTLIFIF